VASRGKQIEEYRGDLFRNKYLSQVKPFPRVRELFERLLADDFRIALASSAKSTELQTYKEIAQIADLLETETSSADADKSKPHPDIFLSAVSNWDRHCRKSAWSSETRRTMRKQLERLASQPSGFCAGDLRNMISVGLVSRKSTKIQQICFSGTNSFLRTGSVTLSNSAVRPVPCRVDERRKYDLPSKTR
jgi:Haloacid dehalogenase-like hydrolase